MARPRKKGLDYYPIDVGFLDDVKVMRITSKCGAEAVSVLICLLGEIYAEEGYYMEVNEDTAFIIGRKCGLGEDKVLEVINRAKEAGFFDKKMAEKYRILTSKGIQGRYLEATAKRKGGYIKREFDVLIAPETPVSDTETLVNSPKTKVSDTGSTQSKVKESKVKESKEDKNIARARARDIPPDIEDVKAYILEKNYSVDAEQWFDFYQSKGWFIGKSKMKDWKSAVRTWERNNRNKPNYEKPKVRNEVLEMLKEGDY
jgi:hypothetical protein